MLPHQWRLFHQLCSVTGIDVNAMARGLQTGLPHRHVREAQAHQRRLNRETAQRLVQFRADVDAPAAQDVRHLPPDDVTCIADRMRKHHRPLDFRVYQVHALAGLLAAMHAYYADASPSPGRLEALVVTREHLVTGHNAYARASQSARELRGLAALNEALYRRYAKDAAAATTREEGAAAFAIYTRDAFNVRTFLTLLGDMLQPDVWKGDGEAALREASTRSITVVVGMGGDPPLPRKARVPTFDPTLAGFRCAPLVPVVTFDVVRPGGPD